MKVIYEDDNYKLYEVYDDAANEYYLCIPNNNDSDEYEIFCGLSNDNVPNEKRRNEVKKIYKEVSKKGKNIIYVDALVEIEKLTEASMDNDQRLYNILLNEIHETIKHAFGILKKDEGKTISNVITMVKKDEDDTKFIDWLEINLPTLINSVSLGNRFFDDNVSDEASEIPITNSSEEKIEEVQNKHFTKKKTPKKNNRGFGNIILITIVLMLLFVIGITIAYTLIK